MFDPFSGPVLVRGAVIAKEGDTLIIKFQQSSAFWDESDIGDLGKNLALQGVQDSNDFRIGDTIIAQGSVKQKGVLSTTQVSQNHFQPFGIDWRITAFTALVLIASLLALFIYKIFKKRKLLLLNTNEKS